MDSPSLPPPSPPPSIPQQSPSTTTASPGDDQKQQDQSQQQQQNQAAAAAAEEKECLHKTKTVQFLGRTTPIILQNDNGPCPLLAICNVLLLRNHISLSPDVAEVSQEKLLSLVAERLIDSNSNTDNKDAGYVENQQQNIADAIDLLPRLATGIDVNIKFTRINDFEFTRECAIFDLLDIPLYHGWIVDPQDSDTANAIASKSYNSLMGDLVALETQKMEDDKSRDNLGDDSVDFAAATTAVLGVPSPSLSSRSFDSPRSESDDNKMMKGDQEEEAELQRALRLSETGQQSADGLYILTANANNELISFDQVEGPSSQGSLPMVVSTEHVVTNDSNGSSSNGNCTSISSGNPAEEILFPSFQTDQINNVQQSVFPDHGESELSNTEPGVGLTQKNDIKPGVAEDVVPLSSSKIDVPVLEHSADTSPSEKVENQFGSGLHIDGKTELSGHGSDEVSHLSPSNLGTDSPSGLTQNMDATEPYSPSVDGSEPIYEGEECILDSGTPKFQDGEPVYEGEVILAEQGDKSVGSRDGLSPQQGELIRNFLKNSASQLTFYGLFCLQEGLKERELCVFFRNNHFSTMFKFKGELYLLATDQGYLNQHDLVWEKLNEVNGDTLFMTYNFREFKVESPRNETWDEQNVMASTADYLATINTASQESGINSDLQLAIALQQQEFEQQQSQRSNPQPPPPTSGIEQRLITGPTAPRTGARTPTSSRAEAKSKDKDRCIVM
ncbi:Ubiquitin carboxyl-terminal hydrolase MINDY-1 [Linum grandiflorum]